MASDRANFEIQAMKDGRWIQQSLVGDQNAAVSAAKKLLTDKKCEGARVIRNWARGDGTFDEKEIFSQTQVVRDDGPVYIVKIEEAPPKCEAPTDYYGSQSRAVTNRLFRNYMDKAFVTPTELMHNYKELKRLQDKDALLPSAVDRVAFLQTKEGEGDSKARREEIFKSFDEMSAKARRADGLKLPKLDGAFKDMYDHVSNLAAEPTEADYLAMVVLSRDLVDVRSWIGKLDRLCQLAATEGDAHALTLLDGVIADVLGSAVVQEILGFQPSLAAAICAMLDLAEGKFSTEHSDAGESAVMLNQLFKQQKLPESRTILIDRAHRQLRSPNPLYRNDPGKEREAFVQVVGRMLGPDGPLFGPDTAEALTTRYTRMVDEGGAKGRTIAIANCFNVMPDMAYGIMYLSDLAASPLGPEHASDIMGHFQRVLSCISILRLCQRGLTPKEKMIRTTAAHRAVARAPFPPPMKVKVCSHIDAILERYLIEEQIIEKLDHQDSSLHDRAIRLVQFCAAGVLPEGKAMTRARERILGLLRQPHFDAHFVDGISDPLKAQKALRDFHMLLVRAGFGG
ncbi:hypothetical protein [Magnetospirillum sulfuroxidans]|uniref:Uncharacterized protein n=1 Tax=Magnetospirillum sulfuroxidans TaxID=611300 RepID=A0ABS5IEG4_9PROT|nr:hypothetical protein [Magnetospirillum sulfuroxidans]MBR9972812.1 hypothetical protein [Magnetospirillum sulfuroxidans]